MTVYDDAARRLQAALDAPPSSRLRVDLNDVRTLLAEHYERAAARVVHVKPTNSRRAATITIWAIRWNHPDGPKYSFPFENERWARDCFASCQTGTSISTTLVISHDGGPWCEVQEGTSDD